jgi:hypothetical protein
VGKAEPAHAGRMKTKPDYSINDNSNKSIPMLRTILADPDTIFTYSNNRLEGEYDSNGKLVQEWFWLDDMPVAMVKKNNIIYAIDSDYLNAARSQGKRLRISKSPHLFRGRLEAIHCQLPAQIRQCIDRLAFTQH